MKFFGAAVLAVSCMPHSVAFTGSQLRNRPASRLNLRSDEAPSHSLMGPAAALVAGLTIGSQIAGASVDVAQPATPILVATAAERQTSEPTRNSVFSGNSIYLSAFGSNDDYLDFSMPSYGSSESTSKPKADPPSFGNPFSDFDFKAPKAEESSSAEVEDKAAAEAKKAEDKAAAEAKKAEEKKAAKEAEAAAAAAKKAEKEARRQAELEKQRAAVERAKEASKEEAPAPVSTPPAPEVKLEIPDFKVPDVKLDIPDFKAPDIKLDVPEFKAPDIKIPEFSVPKFDMPKAPSLSVPETSLEMPKVSIPSFDMPKVSAPSFSVPGYESTEAEEDIEPQEVRDERARAARAVYKEADATAKEIEKKAQELRTIANGKKAIAKEAKDEACKTRLGGKFLCIRPLNTGY